MKAAFLYLKKSESVSNIEIVYDHDDWLLCVKPSGMDFHDDDGVLGFMSVLKHQLKNQDLLPVHRLDKPTSGLILVAKNHQACVKLNELFSDRQIEKFYLALCPNTLKKKQGAVIGDMEKSRRGTFKLVKTKNNPAVTQFFSYGLGDGIRVCLLKPRTGKTHQLRVALKSLSAAIVGDGVYGGQASDRLYLHAYALRFTYDGDSFEFKNPPKFGALFSEERFESWLLEQPNPWSLNWPKLSRD
jgi:tRNA pseudouridine32 synthase/23S rRNA pseudouridine746 synthase